jgi:hypothetical protein
MNTIFSPYHPNQFRYRRVDLADKLISTDALFAFIKEVKAKQKNGLVLPEDMELKDYRIRTELEAYWVLTTLNTPQTQFNSLINLQVDRQYWQRWDCVPSNLGRGYLFYFVCDGCERLSRYLYAPAGQIKYLCRRCHKLSYPTARQRAWDEQVRASREAKSATPSPEAELPAY